MVYTYLVLVLIRLNFNISVLEFTTTTATSITTMTTTTIIKFYNVFSHRNKTSEQIISQAWPFIRHTNEMRF